MSDGRLISYTIINGHIQKRVEYDMEVNDQQDVENHRSALMEKEGLNKLNKAIMKKNYPGCELDRYRLFFSIRQPKTGKKLQI